MASRFAVLDDEPGNETPHNSPAVHPSTPSTKEETVTTLEPIREQRTSWADMVDNELGSGFVPVKTMLKKKKKTPEQRTDPTPDESKQMTESVKKLMETYKRNGAVVAETLKTLKMLPHDPVTVKKLESSMFELGRAFMALIDHTRKVTDDLFEAQDRILDLEARVDELESKFDLMDKMMDRMTGMVDQLYHA